MEINICHLYPDLLNVYGDIGNILILKHRAEKRGIDVTVKNVSIGDEFNPEDFDIVFFGGGQDYEQSIVSKDLVETKKRGITDYIESGKVFICICGGYQLLGKTYETSTGEVLEGLGVLDIYTKASNERLIGNSIIYNEFFNETYVGFENHSGKTYIGDLTPLGIVKYGFGNNGEDKKEGCIYKNTFCTYFHGSLLSKNPELTDRLLSLAIKNKYGQAELSPLDDSFEIKAKDHIIQRFIK
ncbi:type 1 glutamine amidotransferase [Clostridium subterminale]|uniref:Lipid II isoglutaminyl synthase (glutamine-hydrolyzing) subunit GatD n=1 Tax=Clostridium subterminale TaxID=1550 RepID=A0ABN1KZL6_CLOSU